MITVTCLKCKRVSMGVTREYAQQEVDSFNKHFAGLSESDKEMYGGPSSLDSYRCCNAGFRLAEPGDCPDQCTISAVIWEG